MAGFIRLGMFASNANDDTSTPGYGQPDGLDLDATMPKLRGVVTALASNPRPSRTVIRNLVRGLFHDVAPGRDWDALPDSWIAWTVAGWDLLTGLDEDTVDHVLRTLGER